MKGFLNTWKKYSYLLLLFFVIGGIFDLRIGIAAIICMLAPVILSVFRGRFWCGNLCPRGSFYDNILLRFSGKRRAPGFLKSIYFRAAITVFMLSVFTMGVIKNWGNPYGIGFVFYRLIVVTTILGIVLALIYNQRTWCNFCPMGSIAAFIGYFRNRKNKNRLLQVGAGCVSCKLCEKKCVMEIVPYEYKGGAIEHHDCIQCGKCSLACPKKIIG